MTVADRRNVVILSGPSPDLAADAYGGGKGGFVRNVTALLSHFSSDDLKLRLSPYSARRYTRWWMVVLPLRLLGDLVAFARNTRRGAAVHLMMTYGLAIYREFGMSVIAAAYRRPLILDIRGGSFVSWLQSASKLQRAMAHWVLRHADVILGQGVAVVAYLRPLYGSKVHHFPNFMQAKYLPTRVAPRFDQPELRVVFVGYCYEGKGVFELVEGCADAARQGLRVSLTLIGAESAEFKAHLDASRLPDGMQVVRCGVLEFDQVQAQLARQDIFGFPTRHEGEGHPNVITEAMAHALAIVTTRHGFIGELLDDSCAYFLESGSPAAIADMLVHINSYRDEARTKGDNARVMVEKSFMEMQVLGRLRGLYRGALQRG
jgi:glycosyltransferase involved in cell wall biosynthesis